ncbi:MAG TPA: hypothetical protein VJ885_05070 [Thermoanaerobaculia bacterium]|nr:hypothetical protein [Thermoanaerobaculia bacterium]
MGSRGERLQELDGRLWRWLFPPEVELPERARQVLAELYPTLDLGRVRFHLGLPHFLRNVADGITLPGVLSPRLCRIYIRRRSWRPASPNGLGLLAHEAYHALQMQEAGPGLGLIRPFIVLYLACAAGNGFRYAGHPLEDDAYSVAGRSYCPFEGACAAGHPLAPIAVRSSGLRFWQRLTASAPGGALFMPVWLLAWTGATAVLWIAWLLVVSVGAPIAVLTGVAGSLLNRMD